MAGRIMRVEVGEWQDGCLSVWVTDGDGEVTTGECQTQAAILGVVAVALAGWEFLDAVPLGQLAGGYEGE